MLVRDVMTTDPVTVGTTTTLEDAAALLARHRISALPVVGPGAVVLGVLSEADLLGDAFAPDRRRHLIPPHDTPSPASPVVPTVAEAMTAPAVTVHASTDVVEVVDLVHRHGYKSLPVVDDRGGLVGVVSRSDLVRVRARSDETIRREVAAVLRGLEHPEWEVSVTARAVHVTGPASAAERELAEACAASIPGVRSVTTGP